MPDIEEQHLKQGQTYGELFCEMAICEKTQAFCPAQARGLLQNSVLRPAYA